MKLEDGKEVGWVGGGVGRGRKRQPSLKETGESQAENVILAVV